MSERRKFMEGFEKKVRQTIRQYNLFKRQDKIAVAVSGGKDSTVLLYILKKMGYNVEGITIDAVIGNYTKQNLENLKEVCKKHDIKLHIVSFREEFGMSLCYMRSVLDEKAKARGKQKGKPNKYSSCMICGILKRYLLNKYARDLGFNYLATGHNMDDEAQSFMMNVFRNDFSLGKRMGPITGMKEQPGLVRRVKPLARTSEEDIKRYSQIMEFPVNYGICPCSVNAYRREYIKILDEFEKTHPCVKNNIVKFQDQLKALAIEQGDDGQVSTCKNCGEPSNNELCRTCTLFEELNVNPDNPTIIPEDKDPGPDYPDAQAKEMCSPGEQEQFCISDQE
ncbi:TPA: TIGR00269 family protein [Candidatus Woesearchaeota archaeon]|nr:TIGR00269 family protein [Candidatus Woesearchaeota archaeon]